jgi:NAD(P)-dependent dehydrogenase (short-subunit alcohol dehydrogenase family)
MDKTILITGGSSGLGLEACKQLGAMGYKILFTGRDQHRCEKAKQEIKNYSSSQQVNFFIADLSSQKQIRRLNDEIRKKTSEIDVLINNAGGVFPGFTLSEDGIEKTFALNHLAYFLLTQLIIDLIPDGGRIINVSSDSHFSGRIDFESITKNKNYNILKAYSQSKLANVLFTHELANNLIPKNITVNAIHPGRVKTHIGNKNQPWYLSLGWTLLTFFSSITPEVSVKTFVYLATDDAVKKTTGKYFALSQEKKSSIISYDDELAKKLWNESLRLTLVNGNQ